MASVRSDEGPRVEKRGRESDRGRTERERRLDFERDEMSQFLLPGELFSKREVLRGRREKIRSASGENEGETLLRN